jgi:hypothetical protein
MVPMGLVWAAIDLFAAECARDERRKDRDDGGIDRSERGFTARGRSSGGWISSSTYTTPSAFAVDQQPTAAHAAERRRMTGRWARPS